MIVMWQKAIPPFGSSVISPRDYVTYSTVYQQFDPAAFEGHFSAKVRQELSEGAARTDPRHVLTLAGDTSLLIGCNASAVGVTYPQISENVRYHMLYNIHIYLKHILYFVYLFRFGTMRACV
jgi:hypothetical protein